MTLFEAVIFFIPAGIGNLAPVIVAKMPLLKQLKTPIDFGKSWDGIPLLGANKTWRGLISGTLAGGLTALLLYETNLYDAGLGMTFAMGAALGLGALIGDAVESFFKRRMRIESGNAWFPFDQTDYIIGALLFVAPLKQLELQHIGIILLSYFLLHLISSYAGFLLGLKAKPI